MSHFELSWLGGTAERLFNEHRGDVDDLPWGRFDRAAFAPWMLDQARKSWTVGAHQEWCAAASFAKLLHALIAAGAPVDLVGMAGRFVADEMVHTELNARMAAEVGGGVALAVDPQAVSPVVDEDLDALQQACELAIRVSCVGESFSLPVLAHTRAVATDPLVKAVLTRIVADEAPHAKLGWLVLDWALPRVADREKERLAHVAEHAISALAPVCHSGDSGMSEATMHQLGWLTPAAYQAVALDTIERKIRAPLGLRGVVIRDTMGAHLMSEAR